MQLRDRFVRSTLFSLVLVLLAASIAGCRAAAAAGPPSVDGLSHVPTAVNDLQRASEDFARLGFVLKPGRPHANGIRNNHIKFRDGTELELIAASRSVDSITASYLRFLSRGDGPAFLSLYVRDLARLAQSMDTWGVASERGEGFVSFPDDAPAAEIFFGGLNHSPTDLPQHFAHANGADGLLAVWLAGKDLSAERQLLQRLGGVQGVRSIDKPIKARATTFRFGAGEVRLLPAAYEAAPGHPIVGVTLRVCDLAKTKDVLRAGGLSALVEGESVEGKSVYAAPAFAHGMWIEFLQPKDSRRSCAN
ncbi:MAG: VOC family protein [Rudaea sp.]|uniref:VOC family protein n=1 Tax=unclassified Rudaea TaxID=2627037 RepID=UPI0014851A77|nr:MULTISPECIES: VOC family protein [unclassified Rudaea]MBN8886072.1 VOC family protein [Rudaea sp.]